MPSRRRPPAPSIAWVAAVAVLTALVAGSALTAAGAPAGAGPTGAVAVASAAFTPGVDVPLDWLNDIDDHGRIAGSRGAVGAVFDPATGAVTEIGDLGGGSSAEAITDGGTVVGNSRLTPGSEDVPIRFDLATGTTTELGTFGFASARVVDGTDSGLVVGTGFVPPDVVDGFVADLTTGATIDLGAGFEPIAVDEQGLVLGREPTRTVVVDVATGARIDLAERVPGFLVAGALSDTGLVAGVANGPNGWQVFVHDLAAGTTDRIDFDGFLSGYSPTVAAVTDAGVVAGTGVGLDVVHGFVAVPGAGVLEEVPAMPGDVTTSVELLNDRGELAGRSCFWEDVTPALHCDEPFRSSVSLPPGPPRSLTASGCAAPALLAWAAPRSDGFGPLTGYDVLRDGAAIATVPPSTTSFTDPGATDGATYAIVARNAQGASIPTAGAPWPAWPCRGGTVRGTVTSGGAPVPGIGVRLVDAADGHLVRKGVTDAAGQFRFASLPPGRDAVRFHDPTSRLLLEWFDDAPDLASAQAIDVGLTGEVVVDADLTAAAHVHGRVVDGAHGLGGVNVRLYDASTQVLVAKAVTAADGTYAVGSLHPGAVKVRFDDPTGWHQVQWAGGGASFATAPALALAAGDDPAVDHRLGAAGILEGTVSDPAGAPVVGTPVRIYDPATKVAFRKTVTDASGGYRVGALAPGTVLVRFGDQIAVPVEWHPDQPTAATAEPVTITAGATSTVDATVAPWP